MVESEVENLNLLPRSVIPEQYLNELVSLRDLLTHSAWRIGDITNNIYEMVLANGMDVTKLQVCALVANIVGKAGRTVRGYASASAFYSPESRTRYEVLPYAHFKFAMGYPGETDAGVPLWRAILDMSLDYFEAKGLPPSVDMLNSMTTDGDGKVDLPTPGAKEALDPGPDWFQPFEDVTYPEYLTPHPDESSNPAGDNHIRAQTVLRTSVSPSLSRIVDLLSPIANALEVMENAPELSWLAKEIADVSVRLRRVVEAIREEAGESVDHVYTPAEQGGG